MTAASLVFAPIKRIFVAGLSGFFISFVILQVLGFPMSMWKPVGLLLYWLSRKSALTQRRLDEALRGTAGTVAGHRFNV